jgi:hypothetical protein
MMNAFTTKAKRCCSQAHEQLVRQLGSCEMESNTAGERHDCYRRAAKVSGARAKRCMAEGNR